jgi:ABC-type nitrate/sulfonate/bicarbonate transport system substrate-binding protein
MKLKWGSPKRPRAGRRRRVAMIAGVILGLATALAGCSAQAASSSSGGGTTVTAMISGGGCCQTPDQFLFQGVFAEPSIGLNVQWAPITSGGSTVLGLALSGKEDVVQVSASALLAAVAAHQPAVMIANVEQGTYLGFSVTKQVAAKLAAQGVTPSSPLKERIQALKGLTIWADSPGSRDVLFNKMFADNGVNPNDVKYQYGSDAAGAAAWKSGNLDVYECCDSSVFQEQPGAVTWIKPGEVPELMADIHLVWATSQSYAAAHPDIIKKVEEGMNATTEVMAAAKPGTSQLTQVLTTLQKANPAISTSDIDSSFNDNWENHVTILNPVDCKTLETTIQDYNAGQPATGAKVTESPKQIVAPGLLKNDCL